MARLHRCGRSTGGTPDARPRVGLWLGVLGAVLLALPMALGAAAAQAPAAPAAAPAPQRKLTAEEAARRRQAQIEAQRAARKAASAAAVPSAAANPVAQSPALSIDPSAPRIDAPAGGGDITYGLSVRNLGRYAASGVVVVILRDNQPQTVTFSGPEGCNTQANACSLGRLEANGEKDIAVTQPGAGGGFTLAARATSKDPRLSADTTLTVAAPPPPPQPADIFISADPDMIKPESADKPVAYTVTVGNKGAGPSANVAVSAQFSTQQQASPPAVSGDCTALPCMIASLGPNESKTFQVSQPIISPDGYTIALQASGEANDSDPSNNTRTITVAAVPKPGQADLFISTNPAMVTLGPDDQSVAYSVTLGNKGPDAATNVTVSAQVGGQQLRLSASGDCNALPCTIASLGPGENRTIQVTQPIANPGGFTVQLAASSPQADPVQQNNSATVAVAPISTSPPPGPWWRRLLPWWPILPVLVALGTAGLLVQRHVSELERRKTLKKIEFWRPQVYVTPKPGVPSVSRPGPLKFRAPPVGLTVRLTLGDGGPKGDIPMTARVKHD